VYAIALASDLCLAYKMHLILGLTTTCRLSWPPGLSRVVVVVIVAAASSSFATAGSIRKSNSCLTWGSTCGDRRALFVQLLAAPRNRSS